MGPKPTQTNQPPPASSSQNIDEVLASLSANLTANISAQIAAFQTSVDNRYESLNNIVTDLANKLANISSSSSTPPPPPPPTSPHPLQFTHPPISPPFLSPARPIPELPKPPKIQLLPFDGSAPLDWIFQAEHYFRFYHIPPEQRLDLAAFYMVGEALSWFKWMHTNMQLSTWEAFTQALETRFGPSSYANHQAALFKLRQSSSISDYQAQFERLCNRVIGLPHEAILNCFLSGLKSKI